MVAQTIKKQIFRNRLSARMIGAYALIDHGNGFSFKFKGSKVFNYCKIILENDLYKIQFCKLNRIGDIKKQNQIDGVYWDQLVKLFEKNTGLYLSI